MAVKPHRFAVGETVQFQPRRRTMADHQVRVDPTERYTVSLCLPLTGFDPQYRIKASSSGQERVVTEDELSS